MIRMLAIVAVAVGIIPVVALAQTSRPSAGFGLTIHSTADPATFDPRQLAEQQRANPYNAWQQKLPGYGVVREVRSVDVEAGAGSIRFSDVAAGIDPTTVAFESLTAPDSTTVLEQSYEYDLVSAARLLEKYLGKTVTVLRKAGNEKVEQVQGDLLSADEHSLVIRAGDGGVLVISRSEITGITLARQETGLITKPTLVWKLKSDKAGKQDVKVTYQTDGLTWRADYNVLVNRDDTAADIGAWVSIINQSGATYPDAALKLVAGDVQRIQAPQPVAQPMRLARSAGAANEGFQEKAFFEYHLYTLGRATTLSDRSTKQIELFPSHGDVPVNKTYVYYGLAPEFRLFIPPQPNPDRNFGMQSNKKVDIYLLIQNTEKNGLGIPLPAGRIRVYKKDEADGSNEFIGEDVIQHTPKDEQLMIRLGSAFDVVGERKQTDFNANYDGHVIKESFEITLRNHKKEPVNVIVKENLLRWTNWEITESSDKYEKQDYRTIHIPVTVPADGEKKVTYSVRYTW